MPRVVFLVFDGLPSRHVSLEVTPNLWALAEEAGRPPASATGVMPSATYPNHVTFVTGAKPAVHGVVANWLLVDGKPTPSEAVGPAVPTLFDVCAGAGRSSAFVAGDQHLVGVMAGDHADEHWPHGGSVPDDAPVDGLGYLDDAETVAHVADALDAGHDFVFAQINGPDTVGHLHGPDTDTALDGYRAVDALVPALREALGPSWGDTVVIAVSDHTMEPLTHPEPIDVFTLAAEHGLAGLPEGGAALIAGDDDPTWLSEIEGCAGYEAVGPDHFLAWTHSGYWFAVEGLDTEYRGMHGNPSTLEQVALVSGGHPAARDLAGRISTGDVSSLDWAPTVAALLELGANVGAGFDGRDLLAR